VNVFTLLGLSFLLINLGCSSQEASSQGEILLDDKATEHVKEPEEKLDDWPGRVRTENEEIIKIKKSLSDWISIKNNQDSNTYYYVIESGYSFACSDITTIVQVTDGLVSDRWVKAAYNEPICHNGKKSEVISFHESKDELNTHQAKESYEYAQYADPVLYDDLYDRCINKFLTYSTEYERTTEFFSNGILKKCISHHKTISDDPGSGISIKEFSWGQFNPESI
jgi:hypothetical protein